MASSDKESLTSNPFLALFSTNLESRTSHGSTIPEQEPLTQQDSISLVSLKHQQKQISSSTNDVEADEQMLNDVLQRVFLVTIDNGKKPF